MGRSLKQKTNTLLHLNLLEILKLKTDLSLFSNNQLRIKNRKKLFVLLNTELSKHTFDKLFKACLEKDIPIGKIRNMKEVFELADGKQMLQTNKGIITVKSVAFKIN